MSREEHPLRLFVAAYPPRAVVDSAFEAMSKLALPPHRPTPVEQIHITLQFIGEVSQRELEETTKTVESALQGVRAFALTPLKLISLPQRGPKRLIAVETDAPQPLIGLHRRLAQRLSRAARLNPADRFLPHLTLCRFGSPTKMHDIDTALNIDAFAIDSVRLMRSVIRPIGVEHTPIATFQLA